MTLLLNSHSEMSEKNIAFSTPIVRTFITTGYSSAEKFLGTSNNPHRSRMQAQTKLHSFVPGADESLFPLYNLPYGVFCSKNASTPRIGTAIGDYVLDLALLEKKGLLPTREPLFNQDALNVFAAQGQPTWSAVRHRLQTLL